jgi:hypothetical protein
MTTQPTNEIRTRPGTVIKPIQLDGQHFVDVHIEGLEPKRRGPYSSAEEAATAAEQLVRFSRMLHTRA